MFFIISVIFFLKNNSDHLFRTELVYLKNKYYLCKKKI